MDIYVTIPCYSEPGMIYKTVYLSPIVDCFDGFVVSRTISTHPTVEMANKMLDQAACSMQKGEHPIDQSDRGGHYRWSGWIEKIKLMDYWFALWPRKPVH